MKSLISKPVILHLSPSEWKDLLTTCRQTGRSVDYVVSLCVRFCVDEDLSSKVDSYQKTGFSEWYF